MILNIFKVMMIKVQILNIDFFFKKKEKYKSLFKNNYKKLYIYDIFLF